MDKAVLTQTLLLAYEDLDESGGWDQSDHLFTLQGPEHDPDMGYVMQIPAPTARFLTTLLDLDLRAQCGILGFVLVFGTIRCLMGVLRDGTIAVIPQREGGAPMVADRLPVACGDHDEVAEVVTRLLRPVTLQRQILVRLEGLARQVHPDALPTVLRARRWETAG